MEPRGHRPPRARGSEQWTPFSSGHSDGQRGQSDRAAGLTTVPGPSPSDNHAPGDIPVSGGQKEEAGH